MIPERTVYRTNTNQDRCQIVRASWDSIINAELELDCIITNAQVEVASSWIYNFRLQNQRAGWGSISDSWISTFRLHIVASWLTCVETFSCPPIVFRSDEAVPGYMFENGSDGSAAMFWKDECAMREHLFHIHHLFFMSEESVSDYLL